MRALPNHDADPFLYPQSAVGRTAGCYRLAPIASLKDYANVPSRQFSFPQRGTHFRYSRTVDLTTVSSQVVADAHSSARTPRRGMPRR